MSKIKIIILLAVALVVVGGIYWAVKISMEPGALDGFAQCLKDKKATFYGAFWCPVCKKQKAMFGKSAQQLAYVECSTPDGRNQYQMCKDKEVKAYPTWEFADGSREVGEVPLAKLAEKTGCVLPETK